MEVSDALHELFNFVSIFLAIGAAGFFVFVVRRMARPADDPARDALARVERGTAVIGLIGALMLALATWMGLSAVSAARHTTVGAILGRNPTSAALQVGGLVLAIIGFFMALRAMRAGWWLAAIALTCYQLRGLASGQLPRLVNPVHVFAGALWIGSLFSMVFAGIAGIVRSELPRERRGAMVADMVATFSPLALFSAAVLAIMGVITALNHLEPISSLWTTSYGYALIVKLVLVLIVVALGAVNWRRVGPSLGSDERVATIRRSAGTELGVAGLVLVVTAVLVSLPSPREAKEHQGPPRSQQPVGAPGAPGGNPQVTAPAPRPS